MSVSGLFKLLLSDQQSEVHLGLYKFVMICIYEAAHTPDLKVPPPANPQRYVKWHEKKILLKYKHIKIVFKYNTWVTVLTVVTLPRVLLQMSHLPAEDQDLLYKDSR